MPIVALWAFKTLFGEDGSEGLKMLAGTEMERETKRLAKEERSNVSSPAVLHSNLIRFCPYHSMPAGRDRNVLEVYPGVFPKNPIGSGLADSL